MVNAAVIFFTQLPSLSRERVLASEPIPLNERLGYSPAEFGSLFGRSATWVPTAADHSPDPR